MTGRLKRTALVLVVTGPALLFPAAVQATDCRSLYEAAESAGVSEPHKLSSLLKQAQPKQSDPGCDQRFIDGLKRRAGNAYLKQASDLSEIGKKTEAAALLDQALADGVRVWQLHAARGDLASAARDRPTAVRQYESAIELISNLDETPTPPSTEILNDIHRKAQNARLLLPPDVHVEASRNRAGGISGVLTPSLRGHEVEEVALAIQFEFGSERFTKVGQLQAAELLEALQQQKPARVILIGHTDPVGTHSFNDALSLRRAEAVKEYLVRGGLVGEIVTKGRGKREPNKAALEPGIYSVEEQHQLHRRVELDRE